MKLLEIRLVSVEFRAKNSNARLRATTFASIAARFAIPPAFGFCVDYVSRVKNKGKGRRSEQEVRRGEVSYGPVQGSLNGPSHEIYLGPIIYTA